MKPSRSLAELDHLVIAAATLTDGIDWVASMTGTAPVMGGKHDAMGTHNALLRLGARSYLEVIAIDPEATAPARPRWFGLDNAVLRSELRERPRLVHWVARTAAIEGTVVKLQANLGTVQMMARGDYRWRITIRDDGALTGGGLIPSLIQWDVPMHPTDRLPASGVTLRGLAGSHPDPKPIRGALAAIGLEHTLPVTYDRESRFVAMLQSSRGVVTLSS